MKITYQQVIKAYAKVKTRAEAIDQAKLKWDFWSSCTLTELRAHFTGAYCGLCKLFAEDGITCPLIKRKQCPNHFDCCKLYDDTYRRNNDVLNKNKPLSLFHKAAKALADKIGQLK